MTASVDLELKVKLECERCHQLSKFKYYGNAFMCPQCNFSYNENELLTLVPDKNRHEEFRQKYITPILEQAASQTEPKDQASEEVPSPHPQPSEKPLEPEKPERAETERKPEGEKDTSTRTNIPCMICYHDSHGWRRNQGKNNNKTSCNWPSCDCKGEYNAHYMATFTHREASLKFAVDQVIAELDISVQEFLHRAIIHYPTIQTKLSELAEKKLPGFDAEPFLMKQTEKPKKPSRAKKVTVILMGDKMRIEEVHNSNGKEPAT